MALGLYMDQHVPRAITNGLRLRNVDVLTAYEDGFSTASDSSLLDQATILGRVLFTQDDDLLAEATQRQQMATGFGGVIYAHQLRISIGQCIDELALITTIATLEDVLNRVIFLPL